MAECSEHPLLHRLDEWRTAHMHVHEIESRERTDARQAMDKRLDGMNEFRESLNDQRKGTVSRELFDLLVDRVANVERLLPIVALLSAAVGAAIAGIIVKTLGG